MPTGATASSSGGNDQVLDTEGSLSRDAGESSSSATRTHWIATVAIASTWQASFRNARHHLDTSASSCVSFMLDLHRRVRASFSSGSDGNPQLFSRRNTTDAFYEGTAAAMGRVQRPQVATASSCAPDLELK